MGGDTGSMGFAGARICLVMTLSIAQAGCKADGGDASPLVEPMLLGHRAIVQTEQGLLREHDGEALPFFRLRAPGPEKLEASFTSGDDQVELPITAIERRGRWLIVRTAKPLELQAGVGEIRLNDRSWRAAWVDGAKNPQLDAVERLFEAGTSTISPEFTRLLPPPGDRGRLEMLSHLASLVRKRGDMAAYARALSEAARAAEAARVPTEASRLWRASAWAHLYGRRFAGVEPLLQRAEAIDTPLENVSGLARAAHYRGYALGQQGRLREARAVLAAGLKLAQSHGLDADRADLTGSLASLLADLGRTEEALVLLRSMSEVIGRRSELDQLSYMIMLGWTELRAREAREEDRSLEVPKKYLLDALKLSKKLGDAAKEANVLTSLLWLAHLEADTVASERWLDTLSALPHVRESHAALFLPFARGNVRLGQGRLDEAERAFEELAALAQAEGGISDFSWRSSHGLGQVQRARGRVEAARVHFAGAVRQLERLSRETDLSRSRALFFQDRRRLFDDWFQLELDSKRPFEALAIADLARAHVLRALEAPSRVERLGKEEQEDWQARVGEYLALRDSYEKRRREADLVDPAKLAGFEAETRRMRRELSKLFDETYDHLDRVSPQVGRRAVSLEQLSGALGKRHALQVFSGTGEATHGFWVRGGRVEHGQPQAMLDGWSRRLDGVEHLYVVTGGEITVRSVLGAFEAKPDLLQHTSVSFLSHAGALLDTDDEMPAAPVVIADPDGTLPLAAREGAWVAERLAAQLIAGPGVTRGQVLERLDGASLFHFAGHGVLAAQQPWDAHLVLGRGETLTLEDLLIARPKIGVVVLSGCETGRSSALSRTERIGLAHAFSLAGARAVLATTVEVSDAAALDFIRRFYEHGGDTRPVEAYRRAALASIAEDQPIWSSFYVLGRRR